MSIHSEFNRISWRTWSAAILVTLAIIGGCGRKTDSDQARRTGAESEAPIPTVHHLEVAEEPSTWPDKEMVYREGPGGTPATALQPDEPYLHREPYAPLEPYAPYAADAFAGDHLLEDGMPEVAAMEAMPSFDIAAVPPSVAPPLAPAAAANGPSSHRGEYPSNLPAGATHHSEQGFATVRVFYATDRKRSHVPLSAYEMSGKKHAFMGLGACSLLLIAFSGFTSMRGRAGLGAVSAIAGAISGCLGAGFVVMGQANIEKHGVTYTGDRGLLSRGICDVTVPDSHQRGRVERPSLLRFEIREDQEEHIVLTSAVELSGDDFNKRLADVLASSPDRDLLVFIHGYNVDFASAVRRTAQIAVDLPFEGVPVCYSWPSQGSLMRYSVDENNAQWTVTHLKQFLLELANESGAESINVLAHSMGNRAMTAALQQIRWQADENNQPTDAMFDRIVLAAPDVDADHFRRDLAPSLLNVANQVTLYASSDDRALIASKKVHGYPRAGESGENIVVVPGIETVDVSGIDLSLLGHSYIGDNESMLRDLYEVIGARLPAPERGLLITRKLGPLVYWKLAQRTQPSAPATFR